MTAKVNARSTRKNTVAEKTLNLRERAKAFAQNDVDAMTAKIDASVSRRNEADNNGGSSWFASRKLIEASKVAVARFFLAMKLEPSNVIENRLVSSALFNAKALKKVVELANFVVNDSRKLEKVMSAFIICALAFDAKNSGEAISNRYNKSFLSSLDFGLIVSDSELAEYIADYQHKFMTGGKDTQSSQARRVLEVLGLGTIENCENRSRGGIAINSEHEFYTLFSEAFIR